MPDKWSLALSQLRSVGKFLVRDDLHDFGYFTYFGRDGHPDHPSPLHHWQYGLVLWMLAEYLTLLNVFFPFDKEIEKIKLKEKIKELELLKQDAKQRNPLPNRQHPIRSRWQVYTSMDG